MCYKRDYQYMKTINNRRWSGLFLAGVFLLLGTWSPIGYAESQAETLANGERSSRATFSSSGESAPTIVITEGRIRVSHSQSGSGQVRGTSLRGDRNYTFTGDGAYNVEPGRYRHIVFGTVPGEGSITSVIRYR